MGRNLMAHNSMDNLVSRNLARPEHPTNGLTKALAQTGFHLRIGLGRKKLGARSGLSFSLECLSVPGQGRLICTEAEAMN
jgi:hypothetical protein